MRTKRKKGRAIPTPEIVAPGIAWKVEDVPHGGHCSRSGKTFATPHDGSTHARAVTLHELGHVKWSPAKPNAAKYKVSLTSLLACEDGRINQLIDMRIPGARPWFSDALMDMPGLPNMSDRITAMQMAGQHKESVLLVIAACGAEREAGLAALDDSLQRIVNAAENLLYKRRAIRGRYVNGRYVPRPRRYVLPFKNTVRAAQYIDEQFAAPASDDDDMERTLTGRWTPMIVKTPERPLTTVPKTAARRWLARDFGQVLRRADRFFTDRQAFGYRQVTKQRGGTVIVDGSSSMSLSDDDLTALLEAAPAATIAIYREHARKSTLTVLSDQCRRVRDLSGVPYGAGNGCDAAALQWGIGHSEPRIWYSDGEVCSAYGRTDAMIRDVNHVYRQGNYKRCDTLDSVLKALAGKPVPALPAMPPMGVTSS